MHNTCRGGARPIYELYVSILIHKASEGSFCLRKELGTTEIECVEIFRKDRLTTLDLSEITF